MRFAFSSPTVDQQTDPALVWRQSNGMDNRNAFLSGVLFGGYAYAHFATKLLSWKTHLRVHLFLVVLSALMSVLITPRDFLKPHGDENPALQILLLLLVCVGLPYFTLASTGPLIQAWFAKVYPGKSPYRLYSLSNVGSFLALLSFPYVFEPILNCHRSVWPGRASIGSLLSFAAGLPFGF